MTWSGYTTCTELEGYVTAADLCAAKRDPRPRVDEMKIPDWYHPTHFRKSMGTLNRERKRKRQ